MVLDILAASKLFYGASLKHFTQFIALNFYYIKINNW